MKFDALCLVKQNNLFLLDGTALKTAALPKREVSLENVSSIIKDFLQSSSAPSIFCTSIRWGTVGRSEEDYNEAFLASLREELKALEEKKCYTFIEALVDAECSSAQEKEAFTKSFTHCARRIKDCTSVFGFAIPASFSAEDAVSFVDSLKKKHAHYVFFSQNTALLEKDPLLVSY